jgi:sarcosine oxidase
MQYDVIVLGLGAMGLAAAWQLAARGVRVLGLEQHIIPHSLGSSHGHTRIIRQAYYEHPAYVPLVQRAYAGWYELEQAVGQHLLTTCPCLSLGPADGELITGVKAASYEHTLPIEMLSADEVIRRFPAFQNIEPFAAVLEPTAGVLAVEDSLRAMAQVAVAHGAMLRDEVAVQSWRREGNSVCVSTAQGETFHAARLIVTAGPWATRLLAPFGIPLRLMRQVANWFAVSDRSLFRRDRFPIFIADTQAGAFYGMPAFDARGVKIAQHYGAPEVEQIEQIDRSLNPADQAPVRAFLRRHLPSADAPLREASPCIYTLTPDRHFCIDTLDDAVVVAAGFSGHGFKFAPVVGEILADLAIRGQTAQPIDLFGIGRFRAVHR